ncbi:helix-turn-helix domain-containing protein [Pseudonocardia acaciae]|uniref:helix-turn-helix domain-containing protein n=1 Tax=Pseudonocardia acaciae TaxID=551276 RepID=UPI00048C4315|nr:helix-turn-helix transcriptional regulator [Pseudonocardia acaciae]
MGATAVRTAKRLLLGKEIKHAIDQAGITQAQAAALIKVRPQKITDVINGRAAISYGDLITLARELTLDQGHTAALVNLHQDSNKRGFWSTGHNRAYHEDFRLMVDLERSAELLRCLDSEIAPDLVQCEAYIRALFAAQRGGDDELSVEDWVQARLQRQEALTGDDPIQYHAVLSESCLWREYGGVTVMREQLDHMHKLSRRPNVLLQILPFKEQASGTQVAARPFILVRVPSPGAAGPLEVGYIQGEKEIRYIDDKKALDGYEKAWRILTSAALPAEDSRRFIRYIENRNYKDGT